MTIDLETVGPAPVDPRATETMVPMRDGVELATDVYLPNTGGPFPTILVRLPYDKSGMYTFMPLLSEHIVARGYAFVVQDVRGKFRSGGDTLAFDYEANDGYDTLDWITNQRWSMGGVGMFGDSYYGFTQWAAVSSGHPALKAIVPRVTTADLGSWFDGATPLYGAAYLAECWTDENLHAWTVDWSHRPLAEVFDPGFAAIGHRSHAFDQLIAHGPRTPWQDGTPHPFERLQIPVLHVVGWFDNIGPAHMHDYDRLVADPRLRELQYLFAGSFDHENYELSQVPVEPHPPIGGPPETAEERERLMGTVRAMLPLYLDPALDFFDVFLAQSADERPPRVRWELGHADWRTSESWPPPGVQKLNLYLSDPSQATHGADGGRLSDVAQQTVEKVEWIHDPDNLVPSAVVNPFAFLLEYPDERATEARPDVLTFTTDSLQTELDLAGPVTASLAVATYHAGGMIHVRLIDVDPDGAAHAIASGQSPLPDSGEVTNVSLGHTGYRVRAGHRIRIHVAASDYPLYLPDPGTGENPWEATEGKTARYGLTSNSSVTLTVLPTD